MIAVIAGAIVNTDHLGLVELELVGGQIQVTISMRDGSECTRYVSLTENQYRDQRGGLMGSTTQYRVNGQWVDEDAIDEEQEIDAIKELTAKIAKALGATVVPS